MPMSGWRSCGAGIYIPREPDPGLSRPERSNSFSVGSRKSLFLGFSQPNRSWEWTQNLWSEAWSLWDRIWADDRVVFVPEPEDIEKEFRARSRMPSRSPKVWADAYMLAFTAVAGLKLITFDRALKSRGDDVLVL